MPPANKDDDDDEDEDEDEDDDEDEDLDYESFGSDGAIAELLLHPNTSAHGHPGHPVNVLGTGAGATTDTRGEVAAIVEKVMNDPLLDVTRRVREALQDSLTNLHHGSTATSQEDGVGAGGPRAEGEGIGAAELQPGLPAPSSRSKALGKHSVGRAFAGSIAEVAVEVATAALTALHDSRAAYSRHAQGGLPLEGQARAPRAEDQLQLP